MNEIVEPVPRTLKEAVVLLTQQAAIGKIRDLQSWVARPEDQATAVAHHGFGTGLRNSWKLWDSESPLHQHFKKIHDLHHPDDMSGMIITCLHRSLNNRPWQTVQQAQRYKQHWEKYGSEK